MIDLLTLLTYTYSSRIQYLDPYFKRVKKYFSDLKNNLVICDVNVSGYDCVLHQEVFSNTMVEALNNVKTSYLIFSHEDYVLYDFVKIDRLNKFINYMEENKDILFIRLIQSKVGNIALNYNQDLGVIDENSYYLFSNQVSIWRKKSMLDLFNKVKLKSLWDEPMFSPFLKKMNGLKLYDLEKGSKVGGYYKSLTYPYIATAMVQGKWNFSEYPKEIRDYIEEYNLT